MATRSRKPVEPKITSKTRVGVQATASTTSATQPTTTGRGTRTRNITTPVEAKSAANAGNNARAPSPAKTKSRKAPIPKPAVPVTAPITKKAPGKSKAVPVSKTLSVDDNDREPIKAFLRIRPNNVNERGTEDQYQSTAPYLNALSETMVQMTDPSSSRLRTISMIPPTTTYTFSRVFENVNQSEFFSHSALPLVQYLLRGENGLIFAYGVTNSGKTYSIQGGKGKEEAGILPRCLDVVFNSIEGLQSERQFKPKGLGGIELLDTASLAANGKASVTSSYNGLMKEEERASAMIDQLLGEHGGDECTDETVLPVDRNYEYAVWVSYAEVYNEKIFDLLSTSDTSAPGELSKSHTIGGAFSSYMNLAAMASVPSTSAPFATNFNSSNTSSNNPITLHRKALPLKSDLLFGSNGKYIHGLREVKVSNAQEAKAVVKMGMINRRVFGTLANAVSSRSHAIFNIKVVRIHRGVDPSEFSEDDASVSRLSIVDLAGSERVRNAGTSRLGEGDRLREAGSINKSLMVLGQCLEAMRSNQKRLAVAGSTKAPKDGEAVKSGLVERPKLAIVPFRHSKITEIFQDFFVGEGRAAMIININPYDTGFDENAHVMRFAALAREVTTNLPGTLPQTTQPRIFSFPPPSHTASRAPSRLAAPKPLQSSTRKIMLSIGGNSKDGRPSLVDAVVDVVEEDAEMDVEMDDEYEEYPLVEELFARIEELELKLYEAEMRAAMIETDVREEMAIDMQERMQLIDKMYRDRINRDAEEYDRKMDEKIDLIHRALKTGGGVISPVKKSRATEDTVVDPMQMSFDSSSQDHSPLSNYRQLSTGASASQKAPSTLRPTKIVSKSPSRAVPFKPASTSQSQSQNWLPRAPSPKKIARASFEVSDDEAESVEEYVPDIKRNPIMDLEDEEEAAMSTNEDEDGESGDGSQAEEGEELSGVASSEGEGETLATEDEEEEDELSVHSSDIIDEDEDDEDEEEDDEDDEGEKTMKFVFEPLVQPKSKDAPSNPKSNPNSKGKKVVDTIDISSEEESFDASHVSESSEDLVSSPTLKTKKAVAAKTQAKTKLQPKVQTGSRDKPISISTTTSERAPAKGKAAVKAGGGKNGGNSKKVTEEDIDDLISKVDKAKLSSKPVRKSTRTAGK